jgi:alpha-D-ribose 1-methylphosphonate 5-triphosphate synthase subunit PhnL
MTILTVRGLRKTFTSHLQEGQRRSVLRGVDLDVAGGEGVALTGYSGSGKSSLLRCIYRTYRPDTGQVGLRVPAADVDLATATDRDILRVRRDAMAMVTQFLSVTPRVSARDLVVSQGASPDEAEALLGRLGLAPALHGLAPATFSGGERQIVNLAMALARPRPLLLLDEATASLDHSHRDAALDLLLERKQKGTAILAIFHDLPTTPNLLDRCLHVVDGQIQEAA